MITVRKLTCEDADAYRRIRLKSLEDYPESFMDSFDEAEKLTLQDIKEKLKKRCFPNNFIVGAFKGEQLLGVVGFYQYPQKKAKHKGYIWGMYVNSKFHRKGIGTKLLKYVIEQARQITGLEQIGLTVASGNKGAKKLYKKIGFTTYGVEKKALKVNDNYYDEEHMVKFI